MKNTWILLNTLWLLGLSFASQAWTVRYQHTDLQGSVIAESNAQGSIQQRYDYKPYGEGTPSQKSGLGYTGHLEDPDLGLTYMQQRFYDPVIGRFYSNDPVGFTNEPETFNRYSYVGNNPYKFTDPMGMAKKSSYQQCEEDPNCENVLPRAAEAAFGEIRSHALKGKSNKYSSPEGLSDAVESIDAACLRSGRRCTYINGKDSDTFFDQRAWKNISSANKGKDLSGGGNLMCVNTQECYLVHSAFVRGIDGSATLKKRENPLKPSGTVTLENTINGDMTLYFYKLPYGGWMTHEDYMGKTLGKQK